MAVASDIRKEMEQLKEKIKEQGNTVRGLKKSKDPSVKSEVEKLKSLKSDLDELIEKFKAASIDPEEERRKVRRERFDVHLKRRFFVVQTGEIYGGASGLFDFGPPACAILRHMIDVWRSHFIFRERMLEIACPALTPEVVLSTSGHVEKFTDLMVRDIVTKDCLRADKLLEAFLENKLKLPEVSSDDKLVREYKDAIGNADAYTAEELGNKFRQYQVISEAGNKLEGHDSKPISDGGNPFPFNLMFGTDLGATGKSRAFLRPETAQGIFVNFGRLLEFNKGKLPFAAAQIGSAYRNEIAPRAGLLRVREFMMAEIEHFVDPNDKSHPKFRTVKDLIVPLHSQHTQSEQLEPLQISLEQAVNDGIVSSQTMAYFLGRTYLYLTKIGIDSKKLRFRQHKTNEMAHYAADCWDAEILTFYGWVECVGHADRSCYDLSRHAEVSKTNLQVEQELSKPIEVAEVKKKLDKRAIGKALKKEGQALMKYLDAMSVDQANQLRNEFASNNGIAKVDVNGKVYEVKSDWITLTDTTKTVRHRHYVPHVIEPSFGLGRILYCVLEHAYDDQAFENEEEKDDKKTATSGEVVRAVLRLPNLVAPYKAAVLSLSRDSNIEQVVESLVDDMSESGLSVRDDTSSASIGRKYSRIDELGIPYAITVDFESTTDSTVTIRDRDSTQQIRVKCDQVVSIIRQLVNGDLSWNKAYETYPKQAVPASN